MQASQQIQVRMGLTCATFVPEGPPSAFVHFRSVVYADWVVYGVSGSFSPCVSARPALTGCHQPMASFPSSGKMLVRMLLFFCFANTHPAIRAVPDGGRQPGGLGPSGPDRPQEAPNLYRRVYRYLTIGLCYKVAVASCYKVAVTSCYKVAVEKCLNPQSFPQRKGSTSPL